MRPYCTKRLRAGDRSKRYLACSAGCGFHGVEIILAAPKQKRKSRTKLVSAAAELSPTPAIIPPFKTRREASDMLVSIDQAARRCDTDRWTILRWILEGIIPTPSLIGGRVRWRETDLQAWLDGNCQRVLPPAGRDMIRLRRADLREYKEREIDRYVEDQSTA